MAATDACDDADWAKDALCNPHLAAAVILHFRQRSRVDPDVAGDAMPSTSAPTRPMESAPTRPMEWGRKIKRSRMMKIPRIFSTLRGEEETAEVAADEEEEQLEKKKGKRRASPQSPLEGYSSASASGGDERSRAARSTGVKVVAATSLCAPESSTNPASCHVRRPSSKKLTKVELQVVQVSLLEEKANLLEEMENWRRTLEQLRADNDKLQLLFKLAKQPDTIQQTAGERRPVSPPSSYHPRSKDFILLPDLNEPLQDCRL
ncbi:uncharacterized protein LOC122053427 [Zingiber officinale]|uniref:uncharacterized protein LOC122053427 n=1 Tax=Zingiber officinale TaxID=94328 RepID=UPI001C4AC691|nr:uncharacterized protein LOC122053427 [Zingiber officinale]